MILSFSSVCTVGKSALEAGCVELGLVECLRRVSRVLLSIPRTS